MRYQILRIASEEKVHNHLWELFQAKVIAGVLKNLDEEDEQLHFNQLLEGQSFKVTEKVAPRLYHIFQEVIETLEFEDSIDLYIGSDPQINAVTIPSLNKQYPHKIIIYSALLERFTREELKFVLGHEIGHIINNTAVLNRIIQFIMSRHDVLPLALELKVNLWDQLSELNADRYGLLAVKDLKTCLGAFFKLVAGIRPDLIELDYDEYIAMIDQIFSSFKEKFLANSSQFSHPFVPIRIKMLTTLANSKLFREFIKSGKLKKDTALEKQSQEIIELLFQYGNSEIEHLFKVMIITGGILMASLDNEITRDEILCIMSNLTGLELFPENLIPALLESPQQDVADQFSQAVTQIITKHPQERYRVIEYLCHVAFSDQLIRQNEINFIMTVGKKLLKFTQRELYELISANIHTHFRPALFKF